MAIPIDELPSGPNNTPVPQTVVPSQPQFYDDQDIFDLDLDELYANLITPLDQLRSHFNALVPNSQELFSPDYQESRCSAFLRKTGFPVIDPTNFQYYSPGYDINLNLDAAAKNNHKTIYNNILADDNLILQLNLRENNVQKMYKPLFVAGGLPAIAMALGSVFPRDFGKQLSDNVALFTIDKGQEQTVNARINDITTFYSDKLSSLGNLNSLLLSRHYLRPFIVDPRIDLTVKPTKNNICAPFLYDNSQRKIVGGSNTSSTYLQPPSIERIISMRAANTANSNDPNNSQTAAITAGSLFANLSQQVQSNKSIVNEDLINFAANQTQYFTSDALIFNKYFITIRAVIQELHDSKVFIESIRQNFNWQPLPNPQGLENGATLNAVDPTDISRNSSYSARKLNYELDIINTMALKILDQAIFDTGLTNGTDLGDTTNSNNFDSITLGFKAATKSYDGTLTKLNNYRDTAGNQAITALTNIEMIMGEFTGFGLMDVLAIQAALWAMPLNSLVGFIDARAFARLQTRKDLNANSLSPTSVTKSILDFETSLGILFKYIQKYFDDLNAGNNSLKKKNG